MGKAVFLRSLNGDQIETNACYIFELCSNPTLSECDHMFFENMLGYKINPKNHRIIQSLVRLEIQEQRPEIAKTLKMRSVISSLLPMLNHLNTQPPRQSARHRPNVK